MSARRTSVIAVLCCRSSSCSPSWPSASPNARPAHRESTPASITGGTITIHSFSYTVPASVLHGTLVKVVNKDAVTHTVTSNAAGKFNVSVPAHSTKSFRAPATPQKYGFHCTIHPSMKGILKVR